MSAPFKEFIYELAIDMHKRQLGVFNTSDPGLRTIYIGDMPDVVTNLAGDEAQVVEGITLVAVPSPPPHEYIDTEYPIIDFWARSPHSDRSLALLRAVYETYHRRYHWSTGNWYVDFARALSTIQDADRDGENGKLYRLSVQFICRNLNHVS